MGILVFCEQFSRRFQCGEFTIQADQIDAMHFIRADWLALVIGAIKACGGIGNERDVKS